MLERDDAFSAAEVLVICDAKPPTALYVRETLRQSVSGALPAYLAAAVVRHALDLPRTATAAPALPEPAAAPASEPASAEAARAPSPAARRAPPRPASKAAPAPAPRSVSRAPTPRPAFRVLDGDERELGRFPTLADALDALRDEETADVVVDTAGRTVGRKGVDDEDDDDDGRDDDRSDEDE